MCQIQFIKNFESNLTQEDIESFFNMMYLGSLNNSHAFGFFNDKVFHKKQGSFNLKGFKNIDKLQESNFLIGHNRFRTLGNEQNNINNHPFRLNEFILVHNGMITNFEELKKQYNLNFKIETDSFIILKLINKYFNKSKKRTRKTKVIEAIKHTAEQLEGSFSCFLYDSTEKDIYYFKNSQTDFNFYKLGKVLIGTTDATNINHIYLNDNYTFKDNLGVLKDLDIDDNTIYLISDKHKLKKIAEFKEKEDKIIWNTPKIKDLRDYDYNDWYKNDKEFKTDRDLEREYNDRVEIEEFFKNTIGYIPEYTIENDKLFIKKEKGIHKDLNCFIDKDKIKQNKNYLIIDIDDIYISIEECY